LQIGIIGSGHIGGTLGGSFIDAGHLVGISNAHGPNSLHTLVAQWGDNACPMTVSDAATFGEVVVVAVPFGRYGDLPAEPLRGKIVVDATNYYAQRDGLIAELEDDSTTSSELLQRHLVGARLVKGFNTMRWDHLKVEGRAAGDPQRLAIAIAGDDDLAKRVVATLIDQLGFDPVDAGRLGAGGRRLQPGSPVYAANLGMEETKRRLAA
jgi:8-hydroxy-5-deazaflavin:NADPH oxidoreductase